MAGRPEINLLRFKSEIIRQYQQGYSAQSIANLLSCNHQVEVKARTIHRRLQEWSIRRLQEPIRDSPELKARISVLFYQCCLNDDEMLIALKREGFNVNRRALQRIRLSMGLSRRFSASSYESLHNYLKQIVQKELDGGGIEAYGRRLLYTHFRSQMHLISRYYLNSKHSLES